MKHLLIAIIAGGALISNATRAETNQCLNQGSNKICVGDVVISQASLPVSAFLYPDQEYRNYAVSSKVVGIDAKSNRYIVDLGKKYGHSSVEVGKVIPLKSLRGGKSCIQNPQICSCDHFQDDGNKWIAVGGLNQKEAMAFNFQIWKQGSAGSDTKSAGLANILAVPDQKSLNAMLSGEPTYLNVGNPSQLKNFKMDQATKTPGTCLEENGQSASEGKTQGTGPAGPGRT